MFKNLKRTLNPKAILLYYYFTWYRPEEVFKKIKTSLLPLIQTLNHINFEVPIRVYMIADISITSENWYQLTKFIVKLAVQHHITEYMTF